MKETDFNVVDYGALGDGKALNAEGLRRARGDYPKISVDQFYDLLSAVG